MIIYDIISLASAQQPDQLLKFAHHQPHQPNRITKSYHQVPEIEVITYVSCM